MVRGSGWGVGVVGLGLGLGGVVRLFFKLVFKTGSDSGWGGVVGRNFGDERSGGSDWVERGVMRCTGCDAVHGSGFGGGGEEWVGLWGWRRGRVCMASAAKFCYARGV